MPKKNKLISIVMPVRNEERYLAIAVERALSQELPSGYRSEVVLALAPSSDATQSIAEGLAVKISTVRVVDNLSGLTSAGLNLAIKESLGEIVVRVDAHSILEPNYIAFAIAELERDPKIGNVGGVMDAEQDDYPFER